ncbi:hypothetical protein [Desulfoluna spongiiphila]|uniref:Uncharacterized protein n=1 Tax=Desulfoluna spongiiphila TaxID=419481 RepID=A0A1G5ADF8_9BACT|nr:hypothetical protein [Desulfoluna spongiiphila]SCX75920.1 hypothetical protein SAMN05216233_10176 [Desulfoluna spongiiphila]
MSMTTIRIKGLELETSPGVTLKVDIGGSLPRTIRHSVEDLEDDISRFLERAVKRHRNSR